MSSSLLEEAIIDAEALKEAALKNAQVAVLEKYAPEVKKAIQIILEQEVSPNDETDDPLAGLEADSLPDLDTATAGPADTDLGMPGIGGDVEGEEPSKTVDKLPLAANENEKLCACPDEDEEIEINFDELEKQMAAIEQEKNSPESAVDTLSTTDETQGLDLKLEEIELDEEVLEGLLSESDTSERVSPMVVRNDSTKPKNVVSKEKGITESLNKQIDKNKKVLFENSNLVRENKELNTLKQSLLEENKKIKNTILELTKHVEQVNLSNAKLLYTNQALISASLNERQKTKIVEAISKAKSVDDVKLVFETLQQTVGSVEKPKEPKSLNEAVVSRGGLRFNNRQTEVKNPYFERMKKMAGINK